MFQLRVAIERMRCIHFYLMGLQRPSLPVVEKYVAVSVG
jgi:hypothetical protein